MKKYSLVIASVLVINFLIRLPFLNFPAHWDEVAYFEGAIRVFKNSFNPFVEFWSYKPPLIFELAAFLYQIFGISRWPPRLLVAIFSSLGIFLTYSLGKKVFNEKVGFWGAILLFLNPLYFTQSNLFHVEVMLTSLFLLAFYFYFSKKLPFYFIVSCLLVLTKEPAVLIVFSIALYDLIINLKKINLGNLLKRQLVLISPMALFVLWMLLNKLFLGWFLWPYNVSYFRVSDRPFLRPGFETFFSVSFQEQLDWFIFGLPLITLFICLGFPSLKKIIFKKELIYLLSLAIFFPFVFYLSAFLPRYLLFTYPGLFLSFSWVLERIFQKRRLSHFIFLAVSFIFILIPLHSLFMTPGIPQWAGERDMGYLRIIESGRKITSYVEGKFSDKLIVTGIPVDSMFRDPFFGYVDSPFTVLRFDSCVQVGMVKKEFLLITSPFVVPESRQEAIERCAERKNLGLVSDFGFAKIYLGGRK